MFYILGYHGFDIVYALIWVILMYVLTFVIDDTFSCVYKLLKNNPDLQPNDPVLKEKCFKKRWLRYMYLILLFIGLMFVILLVFNLLRRAAGNGVTITFIVLMLFITVLVNPPKEKLFNRVSGYVLRNLIYGLVIAGLVFIGKSSDTFLQNYPVGKEVLIGLIITMLVIFVARDFKPEMDPELQRLAASYISDKTPDS